ncbi:trigger factor [Kribbella capetownensis]|uniref:Trigger factor n=1 Tax=Kribbella capetownensis TaxID=1572659 RepID=A0A4R0JTR5_9ACTN|nr:trigger factor [Kribbella capetownensis]TCC50803.1 trigger factor [Kribbella capetownensis]
MKSTVESLSPTKVKLIVEVPFEELKPSLDAAYQSIASQITVPGFRKGKVPPQVIDQRVGRGPVLEEAINDALPKLYSQAVSDNQVKAIGRPEVDVTEFNDKESLQFSAEVEVRPEITLPDLEGLEAEVEDIAVSDDEVTEQIEALRQRFGSLNPVERAVQDNDYITLDLSASKDGEKVEEAQATGLSYQVGSGQLLDGLDEAVIGLNAGESKTFVTQLVGGSLKGDDVDVEVTVTAVKEQELPEFDDEFAQTASEFDTADELKADVQGRLERGKRLEQAGEARDAVLEKILTLVEVPVPEGLLTDELAARKENLEQQLGYSGMTFDQFLEGEEQSQDEFDEDLKKRSEDAIKAQFVLDLVAEQQELSVNDQELTEHIVRHAQRSGVSPDQFAQHAVENNLVPSLVSEVVRGKALAHLVENAKVTDASGNVVELKTLQPDGSYADPDAEQAAEAAPAEETPAEEPAKA